MIAESETRVLMLLSVAAPCGPASPVSDQVRCEFALFPEAHQLVVTCSQLQHVWVAGTIIAPQLFEWMWVQVWMGDTVNATVHSGVLCVSFREDRGGTVALQQCVNIVLVEPLSSVDAWALNAVEFIGTVVSLDVVSMLGRALFSEPSFVSLAGDPVLCRESLFGGMQALLSSGVGHTRYIDDSVRMDVGVGDCTLCASASVTVPAARLLAVSAAPTGVCVLDSEWSTSTTTPVCAFRLGGVSSSGRLSLCGGDTPTTLWGQVQTKEQYCMLH
jgi:hypothetical protein